MIPSYVSITEKSTIFFSRKSIPWSWYCLSGISGTKKDLVIFEALNHFLVEIKGPMMCPHGKGVL